jgi:hypothetical protein
MKRNSSKIEILIMKITEYDFHWPKNIENQLQEKEFQRS